MGVYLSSQAGDALSHVDFGELDAEVVGNKSVNWVKTVTSTDWFLKLSAVSLGEEVIDVEASSAIIDTGSSYLAIPSSKFE